MISHDLLFDLPDWLIEEIITSREQSTAITCPIPRLEVYLNRDVKPFDVDRTIKNLIELIESGLVELSTENEIISPLDRIELERLLRSRGPIEYWIGLTAEGGRIWEAKAKPRWQDFVSHYVLQEDDNSQEFVHFEGINQDKVRLIAENCRFLGYHFDPGSLEMSLVSPWQGLYWREFPTAYRATMRAIENENWVSTPTPAWFSEQLRWHD